MPKYRRSLPQLDGELFLTDGGIETTLVFLAGLELPEFAAFDLLKDEAGRAALRRYFRRYAAIARERDVGFVLESATWRANPDWARRIGYDAAGVERANREAIGMLVEIREEFETPTAPMVISGCIGPRGDGYAPDSHMSAEEAERYHATQARIFADGDADLITALTMTYAEEAIGVARAARAAGMPVVVSFTTETDGRLPSGQSLRAGVEQVDRETGAAPAYYMINCAHPTHFADALAAGEAWARRIGGLRANASTLSHAELDCATALDSGDPIDLGARYRALRESFPDINVLGGCCGTDHRHVEAIHHACTSARAAA